MKSGVFSLLLEPFDVARMIKNVCSFFAMKTQASGIEIKTKVGTVHGPIPKLIGDGRRFKQVLINLVKNATKFTREGSI